MRGSISQFAFAGLLVSLISLPLSANNLDALEKTFLDAGNYADFQVKEEFQARYERLLRGYLKVFNPCIKVGNGLKFIEKQSEKVPDLAHLLWKTSAPVSMKAFGGYELKKIVRPLTAFYLTNARLNCTKLSCTNEDQFLAAPWTAALANSEFYTVEKDGEYVGTYLLVIPLYQKGIKMNVAFVKSATKRFDGEDERRLVDALRSGIKKPVRYVDAALDFNQFSLVDNNQKNLRTAACGAAELSERRDLSASSTAGTNANGAGSSTLSGQPGMTSAVPLGNQLSNSNSVSVNLFPSSSPANSPSLNGNSRLQSGGTETENPTANGFGNYNLNQAKGGTANNIMGISPGTGSQRSVGPAATPGAMPNVTALSQTGPLIHAPKNFNDPINAPLMSNNLNTRAANESPERTPTASNGGTPSATPPNIFSPDGLGPTPGFQNPAPPAMTDLERLINEAKANYNLTQRVEREKMKAIMSGLANTTDQDLKNRATKDLAQLFFKNGDATSSYDALSELQNESPRKAIETAQAMQQFFCDSCPGCAGCTARKEGNP